MSDIKKFGDMFQEEEEEENGTLEGAYEIDTIIDVIRDIDIDDYLAKNENMVMYNNLSTSEVKRGEVIWISTLLRTKDRPYMTPIPAVLKLKVMDIHKGLKYLNKVIK